MADFISLDGKLVKDQVLQDGSEDIEDEMHTSHILGLYADFDESTFTRLFAAKGLTAGSDFDAFGMYGGRRLCNVADDGTITAWYGDANYTETGYTTITDPQTQQETTIQVQVMVRQPKFWYKVVPVDLEEITSDDPTQTGVHGYSGVRMKYYIADRPIPGFKVHPAFYNAQGQEVDCYYIGAYEGCFYDTSHNTYRLYDSWNVNYDPNTDTYDVMGSSTWKPTTDDLLSSIAGAKPTSGQSASVYVIENTRTMARNRGSGWDQVNIKMISAEQLLMIIEYAAFNMESLIGYGIGSYSGTGSYNQSAFTGSTSSLGNGSGSATSTRRLQYNGTLNTYTDGGYVSVKYRGAENLWGNMYYYIDGANVFGDGTTGGGEVYICDDFNFDSTKHDDNYKPIGFTLPETSSEYIKYFGYSSLYDWAMIPSKIGGNSSLPIGDQIMLTSKLDGNKNMRLGGHFASTRAVIGFFLYDVGSNVTSTGRYNSARIAYI